MLQIIRAIQAYGQLSDFEAIFGNMGNPIFYKFQAMNRDLALLNTTLDLGMGQRLNDGLRLMASLAEDGLSGLQALERFQKQVFVQQIQPCQCVMVRYNEGYGLRHKAKMIYGVGIYEAHADLCPFQKSQAQWFAEMVLLLEKLENCEREIYSDRLADLSIYLSTVGINNPNFKELHRHYLTYSKT